MGLKSNCSLSQEDWDFVKKLTRVASVRVLSHQVSVSVSRSSNDFGTDKDNKLVFPQNWSLQWVGIELSKYEDNHIIKMTWEILKVA